LQKAVPSFERRIQDGLCGLFFHKNTLNMKPSLFIYLLGAVTLTSTDVILMIALVVFFLLEIYMLLWVFGKVPNPIDWLVKFIPKKYAEWMKT